MRSSTVSDTPISPSKPMVVVTSNKCGTLPIVIGVSANNEAASIGNTAFLEPEARTFPLSGSPPVTKSFSMIANRKRCASV